jgi:hypothetical protein
MNYIEPGDRYQYQLNGEPGSKVGITAISFVMMGKLKEA